MASVEMENLKQVMKQMMAVGFAPKFDGTVDPIQLRQVVQAAQAHMALEPNVSYQQETLGGIECELSLPDNARDDAVVFYIHGGGLICGTAETIPTCLLISSTCSSFLRLYSTFFSSK